MVVQDLENSATSVFKRGLGGSFERPGLPAMTKLTGYEGRGRGRMVQEERELFVWSRGDDA